MYSSLRKFYVRHDDLVERYGISVSQLYKAGADPGGAHSARAPLKIGKNMIFLRKIVIFHTKYPKNVRASLRSARFL